MKPRRVMIELEIESDLALKDLKRKDIWECVSNVKVIQIGQPNVIKKEKK